jgi:hypothetical protein
MPKILSLATLTNSAGNIVFPVVDVNVQPNTTKQATFSQIKDYIGATVIAPQGYTGSGGTGYTGSLGPGYAGGAGSPGRIGPGYTGSASSAVGYTGSASSNFRSYITGTTTTLARGSSTDLTIAGYSSYALLAMAVSTGSWITVYTDTSTRTADASRSISTDPTPNSGVIVEFISTTSAVTYFTPAILGYNSDNITNTDIPLKVYNNSGAASSITISLLVLKLEGI